MIGLPEPKPSQNRPVPRPAQQGPVSLGKLYQQIEVSAEEFERPEERLVKRAVHPFVKFCRNVNARFPGLGRGGRFNQKNLEAIEFLGWDLSAEEFAAASKFTMMASLALAMVLGVVLYVSPLAVMIAEFVKAGALVPVYIFAPPVVIAFYLTNLVQNYPAGAAKIEQTKALTYVPEIISYMIMSIKLVPNLEKAVEFAAYHGRGKIAEDFKRIIWEAQVGVYTTLSEALDALAYKWGSFSDEFKLALMHVRASIIENTEAKRYAVLDRTMAEMLESIRYKMEQYARDLSQPSVMLFYIGVLLPLILIIILPVGSTFSGAALANPVVMIALYNIAIPAAALWFSLSVVRQRPPTYEPPKIPDDFPGLPKKWAMFLGTQQFDMRFVIAAVLVAGLLVSLFVSSYGIPPKFMIEEGAEQIIPYVPSEADVLAREGLPPDYFGASGGLYADFLAEDRGPADARAAVETQKQVFFMAPEHDVTPTPLVFGLLVTAAACVFIYLYYQNIYKRRVQLEIMGMESEFKDSLYVLASRMGENRPVEEALKHTTEFLPNLRITKTVFSKTLENISLLGMPLEHALFDQNYGSLKNVPSVIIRSSMRILVDSVQLGVNVAARTMMSLSMQLNNSEKVNKMLAVLIGDVNSMLKSMTTFIAPIVLGITTSLQKIVTITIYTLTQSPALQASAAGPGGTAAVVPGMQAFSGANIGQMINPDVLGQLATPTQFLLIVVVYVIELVLIMTYFTTKIEEDNELLAKLNIAKTLPIAVFAFLASVIASNMLVSGFSG